MAYAQYLTRLLAPLGVYDLREESISGAAVAALGDALDEAYAVLRQDLEDAFPQTAGEAALPLWERLAPSPYRPENAEDRRALAVFLLSRPDVDCFASSIEALLTLLGIEGEVDELTEAPEIGVTLPQMAGLAELKQLVQSFVPAHRSISWHIAE